MESNLLNRGSIQQGWRLRVKRFLDVVGASLALLLLLPFALLAALVVGLALGRPLFFRQLRSGRGGETFWLVKFRTMHPGAGSDGQRLCRAGNWLRRWSLDEIPQLWTVVWGRLSLVGPRPLLPQYMSRYSPRQRRRLEVLPGITGLAQVKGRNRLTWAEKLELDALYVEGWSLGLDLRILMDTVYAVISGSGTEHARGTPMPEFLGDVGDPTHPQS